MVAVAAVLAFALSLFVVVEVVQVYLLAAVMVKVADKLNQMEVFVGLVVADIPYLAAEVIISLVENLTAPKFIQ